MTCDAVGAMWCAWPNSTCTLTVTRYISKQVDVDESWKRYKIHIRYLTGFFIFFTRFLLLGSPPAIHD